MINAPLYVWFEICVLFSVKPGLLWCLTWGMGLVHIQLNSLEIRYVHYVSSTLEICTIHTSIFVVGCRLVDWYIIHWETHLWSKLSVIYEDGYWWLLMTTTCCPRNDGTGSLRHVTWAAGAGKTCLNGHCRGPCIWDYLRNHQPNCFLVDMINLLRTWCGLGFCGRESSPSTFVALFCRFNSSRPGIE